MFCSSVPFKNFLFGGSIVVVAWTMVAARPSAGRLLRRALLCCVAGRCGGARTHHYSDGWPLPGDVAAEGAYDAAREKMHRWVLISSQRSGTGFFHSFVHRAEPCIHSNSELFLDRERFEWTPARLRSYLRKFVRGERSSYPDWSPIIGKLSMGGLLNKSQWMEAHRRHAPGGLPVAVGFKWMRVSPASSSGRVFSSSLPSFERTTATPPQAQPGRGPALALVRRRGRAAGPGSAPGRQGPVLAAAERAPHGRLSRRARGGTRVIQRRFNMGVFDGTSREKKTWHASAKAPER